MRESRSTNLNPCFVQSVDDQVHPDSGGVAETFDSARCEGHEIGVTYLARFHHERNWHVVIVKRLVDRGSMQALQFSCLANTHLSGDDSDGL